MNWWDNFTGALGRAWNGTPSMGYGASVDTGQPWGGVPMAMGPQMAAAMPTYMDASGYANLSSYASPAPSYSGSQLSLTPTTSDGLKGWLSNGQNLGAVIQGFGTVAQAYLGWQAMKQAKQQLNFQKEAFNANLNNSISSYNTSLEDKIRGRTSNYEGKEADVQAYLAKHSLKR